MSVHLLMDTWTASIFIAIVNNVALCGLLCLAFDFFGVYSQELELLNHFISNSKKVLEELPHSDAL